MTKKLYSLVLLVISQSSLFSQSTGLTINGKVRDYNNNPLAYASISISTKGIGTISNNSGVFSIKVPANSDKDSLFISFLGYESRAFKISEINLSNDLIVKLIKKEVVLQEVIVKPIDPVELIRSAIAKIPENYYTQPHILNGFYRVDTKKGDQHVMLSEAVFDIYNAGYASTKSNQLRLLKMRAIQDEQASHGIDLGLKPKNIFAYDIIREIAKSDLFSKAGLKDHQFKLQRIINYNGIEAYEIGFDQKDGLKKSLYKGKIYLETHNLAFIAVEQFRSPKGISYAQYGDAGTRAILKLVGLNIDIRKDDITVKYNKYGDKWVLSNVRNYNVLNFKSNRAYYDFTGDILVDYVITGIDTAVTKEFSASETLGNNKFIEFQNTGNEKDFWKEYNIILADYNSDAIVKGIAASNESYNLKNKIEKELKKLPGDRQARVDSILSFFHRQGVFNGSALIKYNGQVLLNKSYGSADRENDLPVMGGTQFRIGSLTKTFTSLLIQQLVEEQKLALNDPIGKFIPDYIHKNVSIEQLLTHTSGIPNYLGNNEYLAQIMTREMTLKDIILKCCSDSLEFKSGDGFRYTNSGYLILAAVIETITHKTYGQVLNEKIFQPLRMNSSGFALDSINSKGYWYDKPEPAYKIKNTAGAGGIVSTTQDLLKWDEALYTDQLLPKEKIKGSFEPKAEYTDWDAYYGYGWMIDRKFFKQSKEHKIIYHPGTDFGYYSMFVRQPDKNNLIILLNNSGDFPRFDITDLILEEIN
jgi:CubicO group peptidase (beta-lactamase class C family)